MSKVYKWNSDTPPKRGAYRVRCDGPNPNAGWRWWDGERWGNLSSKFSWCVLKKCNGRKSQLKRAVLWRSKVPS